MATLDRLFHAARTVAVVGAFPAGGYGTNAIENAARYGFTGGLYPVNPRHKEVAGLPYFPRLEDLPQPADLVVIATPAATVPGLIATAGATGAGAAIVYAAGFAEAEDQALQVEVRAAAAQHDLPVVGPDCLGIAGFVGGFPPGWALQMRAPRRQGRVAAIAQSGQLANHLVGNHRGLELSYVISAGNQAVLDAADFVDWLADDPATTVIALVVEGARAPLGLVAAARRARANGKPLVALKIGRSTQVLVEEMVSGVEFFIGGRGGHVPTVLFGLGGVNTEALKDVAVALAPVGPNDARAMAHSLRAAARPPRDVDALVDAIVRVSQLVAGCSDKLSEIDINPLISREVGCVAADCLVVAR